MKKRIMSLTLALLLCLGLAAPCMAAKEKEEDVELEINWLTGIEDTEYPVAYNHTLGLLSLYDEEEDAYRLVDLSTGETSKKFDYDIVYSTYNGLISVARRDMEGTLKYGLLDTKCKEILPVKYDDIDGVESETDDRIVFGAWEQVEDGYDGGIYLYTGKELTFLGKYGSCGSGFSQGLLRVGKPVAFGDAEYDINVSMYKGDNYYLYGYINDAGEVKIPLQYTNAEDFAENGIAKVTEYGAEGERSFYINPSGEEIAFEDITWETLERASFNSDHDFAEGPALAYCGDWNSGRKYGFVDENDKVVIPPQYDDASEFSEGLARVCKDGKWGFIDTKGEVVIPLEFDGAEDFSEGLAAACKGDVWGFIDSAGRVVVAFEYAGCEPFSDGLSKVSKDGLTGFIDHDGAIIIPFDDYIEVTYFHEGFARVTKRISANAIRTGYMDTTGEMIIPPIYSYGDWFSEGVVWTYIMYKNAPTEYFLLDKTGQQVCPTSYSNARGFKNGLAWVEKDGLWGVIDKTGNVVIPMEYDNYADFLEDGTAKVSKKDPNGNTLYGVIDKTGAVVIPIKYSGIGTFSEDGFAIVSQQDAEGNSRNGIIKKDGTVVLPAEYGGLDLSSRWWKGDYNLQTISKVDVSGKYHYGVIDSEYSILLPVKYDSIRNLGDGLWVVKRGEKCGVFQNPYYPLEEKAGFPVLPVILILLLAAGVAVALVLYRKGKLNKEGIAEVTATVTQSASSGAAKVAATVSQAASAGAAKVSETAGKAKTAVKQMGGVTCSCGAVNPVTAKFCQNCGKPVVIPGKCPSCGHQNEREAKFCQNCGKPLDGGEG